MSFVYIIQDKNTKKYYTGSCVDLVKRLKRHNSGTGGRTTKEGIWRIVYSKKYSDISQARLEEKKIKSYKGGNAFKKLIK